MKRKQISSILLAGVVAASMGLTGCGQISDTAVGATYGEENISLGYMNFVAHYIQYNYDSFFLSYYGDTYWTNEAQADEEGRTMEEQVKQDVVDEIELEYLMETHMADYGVEITDAEKEEMAKAAASFMDSNSKEAIKAMGATEEYVEQMLYYQTIAYKMETAIRADIDEEVSDEEAARGTFSYVEIDKMNVAENGEVDVLSTPEELAALEDTAAMILATAQQNEATLAVPEETEETVDEAEDVEETEEAVDEAEDVEETEETAEEADEEAEAEEIFEDIESAASVEPEQETDPLQAAAEAYGYTVTKGNFNPNEEPSEDGDYPIDVVTAAMSLTDGEYADVIETETSYYVVRLDAAFDENATEGARMTILGDRAEARYTEVTDGYKEDSAFTLDEKAWKKVQFKDLFVQEAADEEAEVTE